jgi:hypothetical protein
MRKLIAVIGMVAFSMLAGISAAADLAAFTSQQSATGLKDALGQGAANAVASLGRQDGFLGNPKVRIPLPGALARAEKLMRTMGTGRQADELLTAMNRAAEDAVPQAKTLLVDAVKQMSVADAKSIFMGGENAATNYFRGKTESTLRAKFLPIVTRTTEKVGLAQQYNNFAGKAAATGLLSGDDLRVETYVTQKALDGLYLMMAEEEKAFRQNPLQAGSDLAKRIFEAMRR